MSTIERCTSAISLGWHLGQTTTPAETPGLHTRCKLATDGHAEHVGNGLAEFDYQTWHWFTGDRRTYESDRTDDRAWEIS